MEEPDKIFRRHLLTIQAGDFEKMPVAALFNVGLNAIAEAQTTAYNQALKDVLECLDTLFTIDQAIEAIQNLKK